MSSRLSKIILYIFLATASLLAVAIPLLPAQDRNDPSTPAPLLTKPSFPKPELPLLLEQKTTSESAETGATPDIKTPATPPFEKKLAETPAPLPKKFIDAGDLHDPFRLPRKYREDLPKSLEPGTTIDGVRFFSYSNLNRFIEKHYRESNFSLKDVFGRTSYQEGPERCLTCHYGIEEISKNHKFSCVKCHSGNRKAVSRRSAHKGLVANPSSLEHAPKYCGKCHADQVDKVNRSLMATTKGEINLTRYAWGAQAFDARLFSLNPEDSERLFPPEPEVEDHPVDDFLRKKCLRCHLDAPGPHRPGEYRATGCAACHMIYSNDGLTVTRDRAIQSMQKTAAQKGENRFTLNFAMNSLNNKRGYPVRHKFTVAIPSIQCEHCHHLNGVGSEYEGLLAKPARPKPGMRKLDGDRPVLYGAQHNFLLPDIHREKGMHCIDCHVADEIKAGGTSNPTLHDALETRCEDCHGTREKAPEGFLLIASDPESETILKSLKLNPNLANKVKLGDVILVNSMGTRMPHVKMEEEQWILISKVTGKKHKVPVLKNQKAPAAHRINKHMKSVECSACHARWSAAEWGKHVIYEEESDTGHWQNWNFSDPTLQNNLFASSSQENLSESKSGSMLDWLTAQSSKGGIDGAWEYGMWWDLIAETDPRTLILGKNSRGKYSIMKPRHQYFITQRFGPGDVNNKNKEIPITKDGKPGLVLAPYSPHTIRKLSRSCESCHGNSLAVGLGDPKRAHVTDADEFLSTLKIKNSMPPQFQLKQMVTNSGDPIQTTFFDKNVRFLNQQEISAINKNSDRYRAYRYLSLRERGFPRLLMREQFPFDRKHRENEKLLTPLNKNENLFYDPKRNEFTGGGFEFEVPGSSLVEMLLNQESDLQTQSAEDAPANVPVENGFAVEENGIVEFNPER